MNVFERFELKRRYGTSHLPSKTRNLSACTPESTEFTDMCDDAILAILSHLDLTDLVNISDTSNRLKGIAVSLFSRKYGNDLISYGNPWNIWQFADSKHFVKKLLKRPTTIVSDVKVWFKLLRNFGGSIKYLSIYQKSDHKSRDMPILQDIQTPINHYISNYCADSLEGLQLISCPLLWHKPFTKLTQLCSANSRIVGLGELTPNLRSLAILYNFSQIKIENNFPNLEEFYVSFRNVQDVNSFTLFLKSNQQIKSVIVQIYENHLNELVVSSVNENLTQLKTLGIDYYFQHRFDAVPIAHNYRFKTVDTFRLEGNSVSWGNDCERFHFDNLKELDLSCGSQYLTQFILRNKNLKKLTLFGVVVSYQPFSMISMVLSVLEEINVSLISIEDDAKLRKVLGSDWRGTQIEFPGWLDFRYQRKIKD